MDQIRIINSSRTYAVQVNAACKYLSMVMVCMVSADFRTAR